MIIQEEGERLAAEQFSSIFSVIYGLENILYQNRYRIFLQVIKLKNWD